MNKSRRPPASADETLPAIFARCVAAKADVVAVVDGERRLTYRVVDQWSDNCAALLHDRGISAGAVVGLYGPRSPELVAALIGVLKAGAVYMPLEHEHPDARIAQMLRSTATRVVLSVGDAQRICPLAEVITISATTLSAAAAPRAARSVVDADSLAAILCTSGSEGLPKAVALTHRALVARVEYGRQRYSGEAIPQKASLAVVAHVGDLLTPLLCGRPVLIVSDEVRTDPLAFTQTMQAYDITRLMVVPSQLRVLLESAAACEGLRDIRAVIVGGEGISPTLAQRALERWPLISLINAYGTTETSGGVAVGQVTSPSDPAGLRAVDGVTIHVVDSTLRHVPMGHLGEICVGGAQLARGYWGRPNLTAERFVPDPFGAPGARLYRTGDIGRVLSGNEFEIVGRADLELKVRGFRVNLNEVESALESCTGVRRAVGVLMDREQGPLLASAVEVHGDILVTPEGVRRSLATRLPPAMVPSVVEIVDQLPLLPNGKIDRRAVSALIHRALTPITAVERQSHDVKAALCEMWAAVLPSCTFRTTDDFFGLGGDSLQMMRFLALATARWDVPLSAATFLENPTIERLAAILSPPSSSRDECDGETRPNPTVAATTAGAVHRGARGVAL